MEMFVEASKNRVTVFFREEAKNVDGCGTQVSETKSQNVQGD